MVVMFWIIFFLAAVPIVRYVRRKYPPKVKTQKAIEHETLQWRAFGSFLILASVGTSFININIDLPLIPRVIFFLFGVLLVAVPSKKLW